MCIERQKEDEEMKNDPAYMLFMDAEKTTGQHNGLSVCRGNVKLVSQELIQYGMIARLFRLSYGTDTKIKDQSWQLVWSYNS